MKIQFLGATRTVTGSCFLVESKWGKYLIDCGMFQGVGIERRNYEKFVFDPRSIDFVILTHAHLDHCGMLPKLYRYGFRGKVYMTVPTRAVVEHMLVDSAKVQEIRYQQSKEDRMGEKLEDYDFYSLNKPIYDTKDVFGLLGNASTHEFGEDVEINKGISFKFLRVGHALGASSILLSIQEEEDHKKILFSGDLGNPRQKLDRCFDSAKFAHYVIMESLYGARKKEDRSVTEKNFAKAINRTLERGGNVIIPAFTYQRSQEILYVIKNFLLAKKVPERVKIYLDSPLAIKVTREYKRFFRYLNPNIIKKYKDGEDLFYLRNLVLLENAQRSKRVRKRRGSIIIAGHGMCAGGRMIYHLIENLPDKRSSVLFVGFQAEGTLGREIVDGAREVIIEDKKVKVKAEIVRLYGFSAHAGNDDLLHWLGCFKKSMIKKVFLVHAEEETSLKFERVLKSETYPVIVPEWKKVYKL